MTATGSAETVQVQAIQLTRTGGPEVMELAEVDMPAPAPGQVQVEVAAAGVNFMDVYQREGRNPVSLPLVLGQEGAGRIVAVGDGVDDLRVGEVVAWSNVAGSYAQRVDVPASAAVRVPDGVSPTQAAAAMLQGMTAHYLCRSTYPVSRGDTVVVHAGAGGVGLLLTQMATALGGRVISTVSTSAKAELSRTAGAVQAVPYDELEAVVNDETLGAGAAVVYDGVGAATFETSLRCLRRRGMLVLFGSSSGPVPAFDLQRLNAAGSLFVTRPGLKDYRATRDEVEWRAGDVLAAVADGSLQLRIGATFPLAQARRAHEDLEARRTTGKVLLLP